MISATTLLAAALVLFNGRVDTQDPAHPSATAVVVKDDAIAYVGGDEEALLRAGPGARKVDLAGRLVLPGLIDAHGHLAGLGALETGALDLRDAKSFDEVVDAVREEALKRKKGEWILGGRWDHESWPGRALPSHERISEAAPDNPVLLDRVDGHMALANAAALALAGIDASTPNPPGGAILRLADGKTPSGLLVDNALDLIAGKVPSGARGSYADLVLAAQRKCFEVGLTSVHDAGVDPSEAETLVRLSKEGKLKLGVHAMILASSRANLLYVSSHEPAPLGKLAKNISVRCVKIIADGALGSRGASLLEPYADRPKDEKGVAYLGLPVTSRGELGDIVKLCVSTGWQVATHAIGDRANREVLDAYEAAVRITATAKVDDGDHKQWGFLASRRLRVEHAQVVSPEDLPRFAALGVIASMQPTHATSDMRWAERRVGEARLAGAYAWKTLLKSGAHLAFGSDFPVEAPDPLEGIYAAVTRQDREGNPKGGWRAHERLSPEEAIRAFTSEAAFAAFEEGVKGILKPGARADLVILSRDIREGDPALIRTTRVDMTICGGEVVFYRP